MISLCEAGRSNHFWKGRRREHVLPGTRPASVIGSRIPSISPLIAARQHAIGDTSQFASRCYTGDLPADPLLECFVGGTQRTLRRDSHVTGNRGDKSPTYPTVCPLRDRSVTGVPPATPRARCQAGVADSVRLSLQQRPEGRQAGHRIFARLKPPVSPPRSRDRFSLPCYLPDRAYEGMTTRISKRRFALHGLALLGTFGLFGQRPSDPLPNQEPEWLPGPEKITFESEVLGEKRTILVRLPERYEKSTRTYPVLYVLDAEYFFQQAVAAVQFLSELGYDGNQHPIPELIVVGIVNVDRDRDYTPTHAPAQSRGRLSFPTSGGAEEFQTFLEREVFPLVESRYRASSDRTLSGWSLGGLFTVFTFLESPSLFSRYLAISPSLWWDDSLLVKDTRERLRRGDSLSPRPLAITLGATERGDMDGSVRKLFAPLLRDAAIPSLAFTFREIPDEGHAYVPYKAYYDGLSAAFADWRVPADILQQGLAAVERFFEDYADRHGHPVDVPLSVYRLLSVTLPDIEQALPVAREAVRKYPYASVAHFALGRLQQVAGDADAARESLSRALELELERPIPQSENLKAIRARLQALEDG